MRRSLFAFAAILTSLAAAAAAEAQPAPAATLAERTAGLQKIDGFLPLFWDEAGGRIYLEIARFDEEILYQVSLAAGLGSNPIGLDRGQMGSTHVVVFERVGPKVLLVQRNYRYRAESDNPAERRAVADSFATSVLWGFRVEAAQGPRVLVDATAFFLRDAHGVVDRIRRARQGRYRLDESRSAMHLERTRGFPKNTEVESRLTFAADEDPGPLVAQVAPVGHSITVRQHHSFVELPPLGSYRPRRLDARAGSFGIEFHDYASPIVEPIERRWIVRHKLEKRDPSAAVSEPVEPIVYYVDNGAPEPIRSALVEGAAWWNDAFEAAGFRNAFEVRVLPEDADPMDVRYNMIHWVHRSTRGWSYGGGVTDPRTGQMLKGNVSLGSLRVRQDYMLGTGMVPTYTGAAGGDGFDGACAFGFAPETEYLAALDPATDVEAMSLARIRQLSAHEVGHTLGFSHNFAASTYGRASVMDYPAPYVKITDGRLDLSEAYGVGIGEWDRWVTRFAYAQFAPGEDEAAALETILQDGIAKGLLFLTDADARPAGAAHPLANLWDNGADPVAMLRHEMEVRRIGLASFGLGNIPAGTPLSMLEAKLLPLYLHHRYQVTAAVKSLGGVHYSYAVKAPDGRPSPSEVLRVVPPETQRDALAAVLETIAPEALALPGSVLALVPPRAFGFGGVNTEFFPGRTGPVFDPVGAATVAADLAISGLLQHERAQRLIDLHSRDAANPDFAEVVRALLAQTWRAAAPADPRQRLILKAVQSLVVTRLMDLAANPDAATPVRAEASEALRTLEEELLSRAPSTARGMDAAHVNQTVDDITRFLARPESTYRRVDPLPTPPGDPIGAGRF